jgi:hypothetical protein
VDRRQVESEKLEDMAIMIRNERPSRIVFGEPEAKVQSAPIKSSGSNMLLLQHNLRMRKSISKIDLERIKELMEASSFTFQDLTVLKEVANGRARENERWLGWHGGFDDLVWHIQSLINLHKLAS